MNKYLLTGALLLATIAVMRWWKPLDTGALPETIIVGTSADFPPFSSIDAQDAIVGFDIDLIDAVFKKLNRVYTLKNMPFESLLPQMQLGSIHVIAAGLSYTPARAERILFSRPHLDRDSLVLVTRADSAPIASLEALTGKHVLVNHGYTSDALLSARTDINLTRLPAIPDALLALDHHHGEVFLTSKRSLCVLPEKLRAQYTITEIAGNEEPTAFGITKKYPQLVLEINRALEELQQDGTITQLAEKWGLL